MRILAVEDDPAILRMLERGLAAAGHQVLTAENGEDGALLAIDEGVDVVLLTPPALHAAAARGFVPALGRCHESGGAPPYWPWVQVLRAHEHELKRAREPPRRRGVEMVQGRAGHRDVVPARR